MYRFVKSSYRIKFYKLCELTRGTSVFPTTTAGTWFLFPSLHFLCLQMHNVWFSPPHPPHPSESERGVNSVLASQGCLCMLSSCLRWGSVPSKGSSREILYPPPPRSQSVGQVGVWGLNSRPGTNYQKAQIIPLQLQIFAYQSRRRTCCKSREQQSQ